jgi:adenylyltransferase/sulfurtransferase
LGTIQATEALKLILGIGSPLVGRLFLFDALDLSSREITIERDPACRTCGTGAPVQFETPVAEISATELRDRLGSASPPALIDVRTEQERAESHIGGLLIPIGDLESRINELDPLKERPIVTYCASGKRSERAARVLEKHGFAVQSLKGGMRAWLGS